MCGLDVTMQRLPRIIWQRCLREIKPGKCCMPCLATTAAAAWRPGYVCMIFARLPGWCAQIFTLKSCFVAVETRDVHGGHHGGGY
jgi:hypothetical protein